MPRRCRTRPLGSLAVPGPLYSVRVLQVGYHTPIPASRSPSPASHSPTLTGHTPTLASHTPIPASHSPTLTGHTPIPASHTPIPASHTPTLASHSPTLTGHSPTPAGPALADGSITLVTGGPLTVLVDTGGPWLRDRLPGLLRAQGVATGDVTHVVATHGHSDHVGNLNLFPRAALLVGFDLCSAQGLYSPNGLAQGAPLVLHPGHLEVVATPGHTRAHVSLVARGTSLGTVVVAGDLFERRGDGREWRALSEEPRAQASSRRRVLATADVIVPGHGAPFRVERGGGAGRQQEEEEEEEDEDEDEEEEEEEDGDGGSGREDEDGGGAESQEGE